VEAFFSPRSAAMRLKKSLHWNKNLNFRVSAGIIKQLQILNLRQKVLGIGMHISIYLLPGVGRLIIDKILMAQVDSVFKVEVLGNLYHTILLPIHSKRQHKDQASKKDESICKNKAFHRN
jgi:hypothetical protein